MSNKSCILYSFQTGLAVGDVQEIKNQARLKKLAMQVELSLDVEMSLPETLRKKFNCVIGKSVIRPNQYSSKIMMLIKTFISGPLSAMAITKAVYKHGDNEVCNAFLDAYHTNLFIY